MREARIYTDGSCVGNPGGDGGYAIVIIEKLIPVKICGYLKTTTNQQAELIAVIEAMKYFKDPSRLTIYSDSAYVVNCVLQNWWSNWLKNNWVNSKGEPVANKHLWEEFIALIQFHDSVNFVKVKGHSNDILNNECDKMANDIRSFGHMIDDMMKKK